MSTRKFLPVAAAASLLLTTGAAPSASAQNACLHFLPQADYEQPDSPFIVYLFRALPIDLNGDGAIDVLTVTEEKATPSSPVVTRISYRSGDGAGALSDATTLHSVSVTRSYRWIEGGDFTGDGRTDALALCTKTGELLLIESDGAGVILPPRPVGIAPTGRISMTSGDLDGDGDLDVVVTSHFTPAGSRVMWNDGSGQFTTGPWALRDPVGGSTPQSAFFSAIGDVDGDGDLDVVTPGDFRESGGPNTTTSRIHVARNAGGGAFVGEVGGSLFLDEPPLLRPSCICPALLDLDADGDLDLLVSMNAGPGGRIGWFENDGGGHFTPAGQVATAASAWHMTTSDFDGDGRTDVAWGSAPGGTFSGVEILRNLPGPGAMPDFVAMAQPVIAPFARTVGAADMDGSGSLDVVCPDIESGRVSVGLNITPQGVPCFPDIDDDYRVDSNDLAFLVSQWSRVRGRADLTVDRVVNYRDLVLVLGFWGESIAPAGRESPRSSTDLDDSAARAARLRDAILENADSDGDGVVTNDEYARAAAEWPRR